MANLFRKAISLRGCTFVLALALSVTALLTAPEPAKCWGIIETETFYSDATHSTVVGRCIDNSCRGTYSCTGTITDFSTTTIRGC
jgi:hypothetical protein